MLKFGLDWSWVDLNYSKYTISKGINYNVDDGFGFRRRHYG